MIEGGGAGGGGELGCISLFSFMFLLHIFLRIENKTLSLALSQSRENIILQCFRTCLWMKVYHRTTATAEKPPSPTKFIATLDYLRSF